MMILNFFSSFFLLLLIIICASQDLHEDFSTLLQLKPTLVGPTSSALSDWDSGRDHCSFTGVTCDLFSNVVALNLSFIHLRGSLSSNISLLPHLTEISLSSSSLSGQLPPSISSLFHLRVLNISNNNFSGYFPVLENLNLEVLDAYNNNFSGPLPSLSVFRFGVLRHLHLGGNFFSGAIPETYSKLTTLEYLGLNGNALTGTIPSSLSKLSNLKEMYLGYYNVYDGGIPIEFGELSLLEKLDLGGCNLTGLIPPSLGKLKNLNSLFLQFNNLSGTIPDELGTLVSLKSLDLSINELYGKLPHTFQELKNLTLLNIFRNQLSGGVPEYMAELPNLEVLEVWENNFTMELPKTLGKSGRLKKLDVTSNRLTGLIPPDLCVGGTLELLVLMDNAFFGPIPVKLGECKSLQHVRLANNFLNGSIPSGLFELPMVDMLEFTNNYFSGELPKRMSGDNLGILMLSNNMVSGLIPSAVGNLPALQTLSLESNKFSGEIPPQIGDLKMLSKLNISGNNLTGEIPVALVKQCSLVSIDFSRNNLYGNIPSGISNLRILSALNLSRNRISGEVPKEMQKMQSLTVLDLSYNNLSGTIPTQGQFLVFNETSFLGNPNLYLSTHSLNKTANNKLRPSLPVTIAVTLLLLSLISYLAFKRWKSRNSSNNNTWKLTAFQHLNFTVEGVLECLKEDNVIGKGGAGTVYRGSMPGGQEVAIKHLIGRGGSSEHDRGFTAEITTLGKIRHRHIVRLLGFVSNRDANLLLYEYMQNGSLGEMLHGTKGAHLSWEARCRIAAEAALGLCYLHHDCSPLIVHRDVKSNNILLDSNFEAHVADFGLAKFLPGKDASECMSSIAGSYGYIAPEYAYTLRVDEKSDVYSFGVVLLELVTGRRPVGHGFGEGVEIVRWVRHKTMTFDNDSGYKKTDSDDTEEYSDPSAAAVLAVADPRLSPNPINLIVNLYKVAMKCVQETSLARPTMREVVHMLLSESRDSSLSLLPYEAMSC